MAELKFLQAAVILGGLVPVTAGACGAVLGQSFLADAPVVPALDNHFRYLSGLLLGLGLVFWSLVPRIERRGAVVRALTCLVLVGGAARLYGLITVPNAADTPALLALTMELVVTPLLALWQRRVARLSGEFA